jgi:hypothetical protein
MAQDRLASAGIRQKLSDDELLTIFINKIAERSLNLVSVHPEMLVWKGASTVQTIASDVFAVRGNTPRKKK